MIGVINEKTGNVIDIDSHRTTLIDNALSYTFRSIKLNSFHVPTDPQEFYEDFGFIDHPNKKDSFGRARKSRYLTPYQIAFWKHTGNLLAVKSNKVGLTTSAILEDIQSRLLPDGAGYDLLLVAQSDEQAYEHIKTVTDLLRSSRKYSKFLNERKTNAGRVTIINPYDTTKESRIIGLGSSIKAVYSWKKVNRIHMSDVSLLPVNGQADFFGGLFSRLANTGGQVKIETIPSGQEGEVYRIYNAWVEKQKGKTIKIENDITTSFDVMFITAEEAVANGIMLQSHLDNQRIDLGELQYQKLYGCKFLSSGNQWYMKEWFSIPTGSSMTN